MSKDKNLHILARPKNGFRRAGFMFSADKPTVLNTADLKKEQIEALKNEPNLVVVEGGDDGAVPASVQADAYAASKKELEDAGQKIAELEKELEGAQKAFTASQSDFDKAQAKIKDLETELKAKDAELKKAAEENGKKDTKAKK